MLRIPEELFRSVAPFLVLAASLLLAVEEPLAARLHGGDGSTGSRAWRATGYTVQFLAASYGGFFGGGLGILLLAGLAVLGLRDIHQMNGLKNLFAAAIQGVALTYFSIVGAVIWPVAGVMLLGAAAGGWLGARLAHRLGRKRVRRVIVGVGLAMAASLILRV